SDLSKQSNLSDLSGQFRGKRYETPTFEHPRPGTGPVIGARKTAPRSLESMGRYEEAAVTSSKTGTGKIINDTVSTSPSRTQVSSINPQEVDLHRLTDQVYRLLEKRIKTERERRGW
ncbi:MAG: hypothetical protein QG657_5289, partial [Acidobacteriota bacterium]|nr:hypothetical protein [Acidobacteriota bacterium]